MSFVENLGSSCLRAYMVRRLLSEKLLLEEPSGIVNLDATYEVTGSTIVYCLLPF